MTTRMKRTITALGKARRDRAQRRLTEAGRNLKRIQEEIAPYVKQKESQQVSTTGTWRETSGYITDISDPKSFGQPPS